MSCRSHGSYFFYDCVRLTALLVGLTVDENERRAVFKTRGWRMDELPQPWQSLLLRLCAHR
jgi:hypothetical protein